jgi:integrase
LPTPSRGGVSNNPLQGLRRQEINGLRWDDFDFTTNPPQLKVPSSISKNRKESTHFLRPKLTETLTAFRPFHAKSGDWVFRGKVSRLPTCPLFLYAFVLLLGFPSYIEVTRIRFLDSCSEM